MTVTEQQRAATQSAADAMSVRWHKLPMELVLLFTLFVGYRAGRLLTSDHTAAAFGHARDVWHVERWLHLPMEQELQSWLLQSGRLVELVNSYYAYVHFPATLAFLVWMFMRRPAHYFWVRRTLIIFTALSLLGHVVFPLAPPRMLPGLGFIDTAALFGPNVYGPGKAASIANQYAAMPSLHIGWAMLVAIGLIAATRSRWRWLWLAHPVITILVVVGTANHWWLDGIVAFVLLMLSMATSRSLDRIGLDTFLRREEAAASR